MAQGSNDLSTLPLNLSSSSQRTFCQQERPVRIHGSQEIAAQPSHSVDRAGRQTKLAYIEFGYHDVLYTGHIQQEHSIRKANSSIQESGQCLNDGQKVDVFSQHMLILVWSGQR